VRRQPDEDEEFRASFVELFFDLVFVLVITQLAALLVHDLTLSGAGKTMFLLLVAWWAWMYTTWMTNWFDPDTAPVRAVLLVVMLAGMLGAIAIPDAFGDRALLLVIGYVGIQAFRNGFGVLATARNDPLHKPLVRIFAWSAWVGVIWLAGALVDEDARVVVWLVALALDYAGPFAGHWTPGLGRTSPSEWEFEPSHFVERIGLFLLIALGESIVATGMAASQHEVTLERLLAAIVDFLITVTLWWLYFGFHAMHAVERLKLAAGQRGILGRDLSYLHIPLAAGIIVAAVTTELVIEHPGEQLSGRELVVLAAGPILYLLGSVGFKLRVLHVEWKQRAVACVLIAGVALLGAELSALATWTLVLAVLVGLAAVERNAPRRAAAPAA
jgi:low temperature requirement protein LtrA